MSGGGTEPALSQAASLASVAPPTRPDGPRFELRGELGLGGMGKIQLAHDRWLDRDVALKLPATELDARRLEREARITARLEHPAIVPIYDSGSLEDGRPWFAMRVVRGSTLADRLAELDPRDATARAALLRHVLAACEGLAFAHERGVVHRDLKPANIMIGAFGETQIIDWGLALAPDAPPLDGLRAGTPGAMSPEQRRGEGADARSDVWSLGAILEAVAPDPPPELRALIARAMSERPDDRYPDAKALAHDLAAYLDGRRVEAHAYTPLELLVRFMRAWRGPLLVAAAGFVVLAVVLAVMFAELRGERDQAEANLAVSLTSEARRALRQDARGEAEVLAAHALARAPIAEARGILAAVSGARPPRSVIAEIDDCRVVDLIGTRVLCQRSGRLSVLEQGRALWSREFDSDAAQFIAQGRMIALVHERRLRRLDATSGAELNVAEPLDCFTRLVGANGSSVFSWNGGCAVQIHDDRIAPLPRDVCGNAGIGTLAADPEAPRWVATCGDGSIAIGDEHTATRLDAGLGIAPRGPLPSALAFLPHDRVLIGDAAGGLTELALAAPAVHRRLRVHDGLVQRLVVSPDGDRLVALGERTTPVVVDLERFATLGRLPDAAIRAAAFDGRDILAAGRRLERWDFEAVLPRALELGDGIGGLAFSPDGERLAVGHDNAVSIVDVATRRRLHHHAWQSGMVKTFAFAQDGTLIAHGLGSTAVMRLGPAERIEDLAASNPSHWRRLVALHDGTLLLAAYGPLVMRRTPEGGFERALDIELADLVASADGRSVAGLGVDHVLYCGPALVPCGKDPEARAIAVAEGDALFVARPQSVARFEAGAVGTIHRATGAELLDLAVGRGDGERLIVSAARDGSLWLFRESSPEPWAVLRDHDARTDTVAFDPLGRFIAAGGWDGHVVMWPIPQRDSDRRAEVEAWWGLGLGAVFAPGQPR